jgi:Zn-dependent protease
MSSNLIVVIIMAIVVIAISITLHEFMHGFVAKLLGDNTAEEAERLSLNPLKHIDPFATVLLPLLLLLIGAPPFGAAKPVPVDFYKLKYEEFGGALVGIAGPLTNLLLAVLAAFFIKLTGIGLENGLIQSFFELFISINIGFFVFNMIPFPPLDGSRVLYAFAPSGLQKVMNQIESFGLLAIALFIFLLIPVLSPVLTGINNSILNFIL